MFVKKADLQIQFRSTLAVFGHSVLIDQHKSRQEDCLDRSDHGEDHESWVPSWDGWYRAKVREDPNDKNCKMQIDESHASREARDGAGNPFLNALALLVLSSVLDQGLYVLVEHRLHVGWTMVAHFESPF
jgi:hypothetical protein